MFLHEVPCGIKYWAELFIKVGGPFSVLSCAVPPGCRQTVAFHGWTRGPCAERYSYRYFHNLGLGCIRLNVCDLLAA